MSFESQKSTARLWNYINRSYVSAVDLYPVIIPSIPQCRAGNAGNQKQPKVQEKCTGNLKSLTMQ